MSAGYQRLDARRKIIAALMGRKAAHLLHVVESESLTNKEVTEVTGLPPGTAAPSLKSLRELRLVAQDGGKAYYVPNPQIHAAVQFLTTGGRS